MLKCSLIKIADSEASTVVCLIFNASTVTPTSIIYAMRWMHWRRYWSVLHATCSSCLWACRNELVKAWRWALGKTKASGRQAAPTCYRDTHKARRIFLGPSNSFLLLSCPYWFGPSLPQCVPVVLIKHKYFIPTEWSRWKRTKKKKTKLQTFTLTLKKKNQKKKRKKENWTPQIRAGTQYLLVTRTYEKATAFP